ncbi:MAG TPA: SGNH/GDSL hydrolase family protein [Oligoflexia bacterium]|nr:SGNH/GDSL hydrolase family protein [Oligoflexia bacterium]HMP27214.1 SGNH/GDSL hydrolase family protein [Oligoflexia bacterium]
MNNQKINLLLLLFGSLLGALIALTALWLISKQSNGRNTFESLAELKKKITERSKDDYKSDGSVSLRSIIQPENSDDIIFSLKPNLKVKFQGASVKTNSFGMRDREITLEKQANVFRIALLGDSFAFGWGVEREQSFAWHLENTLKSAGINAEVLNFGVPGYSTFQEIAKFFDRDYRFNPDLVIVYFIDNDFGLPFFISGVESGTLENTAAFVKNLWSSNSEQLQQRHDDIASRIDPNRWLKKLNSYLKERNIPLLLAINPAKNTPQIIKKLWITKSDKHLKLFDFSDRLKAEIEKRGLTNADLKLQNDPHPSPIKHELIGKILAEKVAEIY